MLRKAILIVAAIALLGLAGCGGDDEGSDSPATETRSESEATTVTEATEAPESEDEAIAGAQATLEAVIGRDLQDGRYIEGAYRTDPNLTPRMIGEIIRLEAEGGPGFDFDPFICAQSLPRAIDYEAVAVGDEEITFEASFDFGGAFTSVNTYRMLHGQNGWQLDSIGCD